jgi:hypothetical protein
MSMSEEDFDTKYQTQFSSLMEEGKWMEFFELCKDILIKESPTPSLRIELLTGIAMAQVGLAAQFTEALKEQGLKIREEVGMSPEEARQVAENVALCIQLKADGLEEVRFPFEEGEKDAKPK